MSFDPARLPILTYRPGERYWLHPIFHRHRSTIEPEPEPEPVNVPVCTTKLPAVMCECRRFFLEAAPTRRA